MKKQFKIINNISIPGSILVDSRLSSTDKLIYGLIYSISYTSGVFNAGTRYIERTLSICRASVFMSLAKLEKLDLIKIKTSKADGSNAIRSIELVRSDRFQVLAKPPSSEIVELFQKVVKNRRKSS